MATRIGIDVGGTFTDLIMLDEDSGEITVGKGPSDPAAVDRAVRGVLSRVVITGSVRMSAFEAVSLGPVTFTEIKTKVNYANHARSGL